MPIVLTYVFVVENLSQFKIIRIPAFFVIRAFKLDSQQIYFLFN